MSGKDLINNHLTFFLFNHSAIFPADMMPRSVRANGHILLNNEKMAKNKGNFRTLVDAIDMYSADGMRFVLANCGDSVADANFDEKESNAVILDLHSLYKFVEETQAKLESYPDRAPESLFDRVFDSQMNRSVVETERDYEQTNFHQALFHGFRSLLNARDSYRSHVGEANMSRRLLTRWVDVTLVLLAPICPHICDKIWRSVLGRAGTVLRAGWPAAGEVDSLVLEMYDVVMDADSLFRSKRELYLKKTKGVPPTRAVVYASASWPEWFADVTATLRAEHDAEKNEFSKDAMRKVAALPSVQALSKAKVKLASTMAALLQKRVKDGEAVDKVLNAQTKFDGVEMFRSLQSFLAERLQVSEVAVEADVGFERNTNPLAPAVEFS